MITPRRTMFSALCALAIASLGIIGCSDGPTETLVPVQQVKVIVRFEGDGSGRVHSANSTVGIDCTNATPQNACTNTFNPVGTFELLATPSAGSTHTLWACSSTNPSAAANCGACTGDGTCQIATPCCDDVTITVVARFDLVGTISGAASVRKTG